VTPPSVAPAGGYSVPQQFTPPAAVPARTDPLVLPPGSSYGAWFSTFTEVAKRSWKSALMTAGVGVAAPLAIVSLISYTMEVGGTVSIFGLATHVGFSFFGFLVALFVKLLLSVAAAFVASVGWAAGSWALVTEAKTGQPANVSAAFQYGMKRAMALFPWAVVAGLLCSVALLFLWVPGLYLAFAFSMFGFVAVFEPTQMPLVRSLNMVHRNIGNSLARVGTLIGGYLVYYGIVTGIFTAISLPGRILTGGSFASNLIAGILQMIGTVLLAPAIGALLIGLLVTYAELRAQEAPTSTDDLAAALG
jgi:hypothetical protein